jgi:hypothetical protein
MLSSLRFWRCLRRPRRYQPRRALVANKRALVRHQAELDVETQAKVLVGKADDYPVTIQAPVLGFHPVIVGRLVHGRDMTGHHAILRIQPRFDIFTGIYRPPQG